MKFLWNDKDGGPESRVWCYGIEIKKLFSIILLRFEDGSREAYHSHAFNCINWVLKGKGLREDRLISYNLQFKRQFFNYLQSAKPFIICRQDIHKVSGIGRTYVLSFRGPWQDSWQEIVDGKLITLTHGRKRI